MVPSRDKKDKGGPGDSHKDKKRRNSLADSSASSGSSSSSCSSTSTDSDGASSTGSACDTKGTMTSLPVANAPQDFFNSDSLASYEQRPIPTVSPVTQTENVFRSLAHDFPLGGESSRAGAVSPVPPAEATQTTTEKRKGKNGKKKKDKKKKDKEEANRKSGKTSPNGPSFNLQELREMVELTSYRESFYQQYSNSMYKGSMPAESSRPHDEQVQYCGFGIAASGHYDIIPPFRSKFSHKAVPYSSLYERFDYKREFENSERWYVPSADQTFLSDMCNIFNDLTLNHENDWMKDLMRITLAADVKKLWHRLESVERVLRESPGNHHFAEMDRTRLLGLVAKRLVEMLEEKTSNANIFMYLASTLPGTDPCYKNDHGFCMTLELLLSLLPAYLREKYLAQRTRSPTSASSSYCGRSMPGRTAVHCAAISGSPCQLDVLLKYDANCDVFDDRGMAPISYLLNRNNLWMARYLCWHGANLSIVNRFGKLPYTTVSDSNKDASYWMMRRVSSLEKMMISWVRTLIGNSFSINEQPASHLHQVRLGSELECFQKTAIKGDPIHDSNGEILREVTLGVKKPEALGPGDHLILVAIPVSYTIADASAPPERPNIVRTDLFVEAGDTRKPVQLMRRPPSLTAHSQSVQLTSAIKEEHNGHIYVYKVHQPLKEFVCDEEKTSVQLYFNKCSLGRKAHHTHLMMQVYVCQTKAAAAPAPPTVVSSKSKTE